MNARDAAQIAYARGARRQHQFRHHGGKSASKIDGFWANGRGAEVAVHRGIGDVMIDARRGAAPKECFNYMIVSIATTEDFSTQHPEAAAATVRAIIVTQLALKEDVNRATAVGGKLFFTSEAGLIAELVRRDLSYYKPAITLVFVSGMNSFARRNGILTKEVPHEDIVTTTFLSRSQI